MVWKAINTLKSAHNPFLGVSRILIHFGIVKTIKQIAEIHFI